MKVLIIDDPLENLSSLGEKLAMEDMEIVRVWDIAEGKNILQEQDFEAIITSAMYALPDGINLCVSCKKDNGHILTILYVPSELCEDDERFLKEIGIDHILKCDEINEIAGIIRRLSEIPVEDRCKPSDECDQIRVMGITRAIVNAALKDLASQAKKLEEILENSTDVIYELDPYGKIVLISKIIETLTGYTRDELMGMSALEMTSPDSVEVVADHISKLISGQDNPVAVEVGVQGKDGRVIPAEMIVRPIWHKDQVAGILGIGRNVEERKRLENSLRSAINEKEFYLDLMAHDIQNFNQAIMGYLEMIIGKENIDPTLGRYAQGAFRQVTQIAQLIAHIKRVAQIRRSGQNKMRLMDLKDVFERSITKLQSKIGTHNVVITLNCGETACNIKGSDDVNDVLDLILSSAVNYSISDVIHVKLTISLEFRNGSNYWSVDVSGNNLRLPEPVIRCVMSPDYSGCQMIERPDLQLLVVRAIIETIGGEMLAKNPNTDRGDGFILRIPMALNEEGGEH